MAKLPTQRHNKLKYCKDCNVLLTIGSNTTESLFKKSDYRCLPCRQRWDREYDASRVRPKRVEDNARKLQWKRDNMGYVTHINNIRRCAKIERTVSWADLDLIKAIYTECAALNAEHGKRAYHVDHIIPLQGKWVSGLHVENNLRIILAKDNLTKSNKYG